MPSGVKISPVDFNNKLMLVQPELTIIDQYSNMKNHIRVSDKSGVIYLSKPQELLLGKTPTIQSAENKTRAFIKKSKIIHGDIYLYDKAVYKNAKTKIILGCKIHGYWKASPDTHLGRLYGCPECGKISSEEKRKYVNLGWGLNAWINQSKNSSIFDAFKFYIIKCYNENEEFIKIGRTYMRLKKRFEDKNKMPYNFEVVKIIKGYAESIFNLELKAKKELKNTYKPLIYFDGITECFKYNSENKLIIKKL
jgi:hypothetical protein